MADDSIVAKLECFNGGVPPLALLMLSMQDLQRISRRIVDINNAAAELCIIGLAAYFEAFCKNQFAAVINLVPQTLSGFAAARDTRLPVWSLLHDLENIGAKLGFAVAEEYDFGTAKHVNSLFFDLLKVTPFSKEEIARYSEFLNDRNLLVHHAGVYTLRYSFRKFGLNEMKRMTNWNSLTVSKEDVQKWSDFLLGVARKLSEASFKALAKFAQENNIGVSPELERSIEALNWGLEDD